MRWLSTKKQRRVRALEHLKSFSNEVIDLFREGSMGSTHVKLALWDEITKTLVDLDRNVFQNILFLRLTGAFNKAVKHLGNRVVSVRKAGGLEDGKIDVYYVAAEVAGPVDAHNLIIELEMLDVTLRDWSFGACRTNEPLGRFSLQALQDPK